MSPASTPCRPARRPLNPLTALTALAPLAAVLALAGCTEVARQSVSAGMGPNPVLLSPVKSLIPTLHIAPAKGWPAGAKPLPAAGTNVARFAEGLDHPRWMYVLPNGDVLVAETNAPPKPEDGKGIKGAVMKLVMKRAGAGTPSANRITLLRDTDGDGVAETRTVFLEGLNSPFGMALVGNDLYVANTDSIVRFPYQAGQTKIDVAATKVADLPGGPINHHWTKNIVASADGSKLYASVGSNSNVGENGIDKEEGRAAIWEIDVKTGAARVFATGLRNPVGMAIEPDSGALWTSVNERDELGSDLVPDYMTSVREGGFYGWPYCYYGQHVDERMQPQRPDLVAQAIVPDYALGPHTASLGLAAARGNTLPERFKNGMFVGQHGSWNRKPRSGYRVIFVPFDGGKPAGEAVDVLTGFVDDDGDALGRPVGVALDRKGALLVADDVGNLIWRVTSTTPRASASSLPVAATGQTNAATTGAATTGAATTGAATTGAAITGAATTGAAITGAATMGAAITGAATTGAATTGAAAAVADTPAGASVSGPRASAESIAAPASTPPALATGTTAAATPDTAVPAPDAVPRRPAQPVAKTSASRASGKKSASRKVASKKGKRRPASAKPRRATAT